MAPTPGVFISAAGRASVRQARFGGKVDAWVAETQKRMNAVYRESARRMIDIMQTPVAAGGNMPVDTGFLRASLAVVINGKPAPADKVRPKDAKKTGQKFMYDSSAVALKLSQFQAGDRLVASYTTVYARRLEYGFTGTDSLGRNYNQPPRAFARLAAQQWKYIVAQVTEEAKTRVAAKQAAMAPSP